MQPITNFMGVSLRCKRVLLVRGGMVYVRWKLVEYRTVVANREYRVLVRFSA